jgi:hypothetical protein
VIRSDESTKRCMISAIGSFGNGGIVAVFAVGYYPHLPSIGTHIRSLCFAGSALIVLGLATAGSSRSVSYNPACPSVLLN